MSKKGSTGVAHDISRALGAVTVAKMAAAVHEAEKAEEERLKKDKEHKAKVDDMGAEWAARIRRPVPTRSARRHCPRDGDNVKPGALRPDAA